MSKAGVLIWRYLFESGDKKRLAKQVQDLSDLRISKDIPYVPDGDQGHLLDIYEMPDLPDDAPKPRCGTKWTTSWLPCAI